MSFIPTLTANLPEDRLNVKELYVEACLQGKTKKARWILEKYGCNCHYTVQPLFFDGAFRYYPCHSNKNSV